VWLTHIGEAGVDIGEGEEDEKLGRLWSKSDIG
jgi:hypothetical protein